MWIEFANALNHWRYSSKPPAMKRRSRRNRIAYNSAKTTKKYADRRAACGG
jgi:hypothetical protein